VFDKKPNGLPAERRHS